MAGPMQGAEYLSEDEGHHVRGLPVAGMEEVGQGHSGEGREDFRAVQGIVDTLGAPPLGCDCGAERKVRAAWPTQGCDPRDSVGVCYTDPAVIMPPGYSLGPEHPAQNALWEMCCSPPTFL